MSNVIDPSDGGAPESILDDPSGADPRSGDALLGLESVGAGGWSALDYLARTLHSRPDLGSTLSAVLRTALTACPGFDAAGVNLLVRGKFEPQQVLGAAPPILDQLQKRTGTGPCIDASREQQTIVANDMAVDTRWPEYAQLAHSLGVVGMVCVPLWVDDDRLGSVSLYAGSGPQLSEHTLQVAGLVATHAAIAIASSRQKENLAAGMAGRDLIGQAKGILMERYRLTADDAFAMLRDCSMATNLKVQRVADRLVTTGELPTPPT